MREVGRERGWDRPMTSFFRLLGQALFATLLLGCGPVPGGLLEGTLAPPPYDWSTVLEDERAFCEIESRPGDAHSIQLDCFLHAGSLYVQSHRWVFSSWWPVESWAQIWIERPDVRLRIASALYELRAVLVTEPAVRDLVLKFRGYDPVPDGIALFRFDRRGS